MLLPPYFCSSSSSWDTCFTFHRCPSSPPWGGMSWRQTLSCAHLCHGLDYGVELSWVLLSASHLPHPARASLGLSESHASQNLSVPLLDR